MKVNRFICIFCLFHFFCTNDQICCSLLIRILPFVLLFMHSFGRSYSFFFIFFFFIFFSKDGGDWKPSESAENREKAMRKVRDVKNSILWQCAMPSQAWMKIAFYAHPKKVFKDYNTWVSNFKILYHSMNRILFNPEKGFCHQVTRLLWKCHRIWLRATFRYIYTPRPRIDTVMERCVHTVFDAISESTNSSTVRTFYQMKIENRTQSTPTNYISEFKTRAHGLSG